ncbi:hypothetical protein ABTP36_19605, partial [Acinetobacter baumannii]
MFREFGRRANTFWIFVTDFETPSDMAVRLDKAGFEVRQSLKQMAWEGGAVPDGEAPVEALSTPDRMRVARFMTETFFNNAN